MSKPRNVTPRTHNGRHPKITQSRPRMRWGFKDKTAWDLMDLFLIPLLLLVIAYLLNWQAEIRQTNFKEERKKQEIIQSYLVKMTDLISDEKLVNEVKDKRAATAAKALTYSALRNVKGDGQRKRQILQFLYDTELVTYESNSKDKKAAKIYLSGADLNGANLSSLTLNKINLSKANLNKAELNNSKLNDANLKNAQLRGAKLRATQLKNANLQSANLQKADLSGANLQGADLSHANLTEAILIGANLGWDVNTVNPRRDLRSGSTANNTKFNGANLTRAHLRGAELDHAHLNNVDLTEADLTGARSMETAEIEGATLCKTTMPEGVVDSRSCPENTDN